MKIKALLSSAALLFVSFPCLSWASNGYFLHGFGAVNESMGGAATAGNMQDVIGSIYRNPANAGLFKSNTGSVSLGVIMPDVTVDSSVDALGMSGSSDSDVDAIPTGDAGVVFNDENSSMAWYFGVIGEAGLHLDIAQSNTNPIFVAQAGKQDNPFGGMFGGFGHVESQIELIRFPVGLSKNFNKKLHIGFSVAPSVERFMFTPAAFAAPDDADGNGIYTYPTDVDHALAWGIGFQVGARYQATDMLGIGLTYTSPTWFEDLTWDVSDERGGSREISYNQDRPMTVNLGLSAQATPAALLLLDVFWINYSDTDGFSETGFNTDGSLKGLGWDDQFGMALGLQYDLSDSLTMRGGYNYGTSPISSDTVFYNVGSPLHNEHHLSLGASWKMSKSVVVDFGYSHAFESSESGQWYGATGTAVPGTSVKSSTSYDQISLGLTFSF